MAKYNVYSTGYNVGEVVAITPIVTSGIIEIVPFDGVVLQSEFNGVIINNEINGELQTSVDS